MALLGIDIGGTKCAVVLGDENGVIRKVKFDTADASSTVARLLEESEKMGEFSAVGISCGNPMDVERGLILSPPNLPGWDRVPIVDTFRERFGVPARICNDANACALAEWRYGAGKGCRNMIFLTMGTGFGAGLILNGVLYEGTCNNAGEIGHVRLTASGPVGYGKAGSVEGYCSGGGIAQLGQTAARECLQRGKPCAFAPDYASLDKITTKLLATYAAAGDEVATKVFQDCAEKLGVTLSILIDLFNPERIVIGSIYARCEEMLKEEAEKVIRRECLADSAAACRVLPAALGEQIGDYGALAVAGMALAESK